VDEATICSHIQLQQTSQRRRRELPELVHYHAAEALRVLAFLVASTRLLFNASRSSCSSLAKYAPVTVEPFDR